MTATTKLEAVNVMLSVIGESPVNSLNSGLIDAETAESILDTTSKAVQAEGWNFNSEKNYSFTPTLSGEIQLPTNILRADATSKYNSKDLVQRGSRMYNKADHTYVIGETVTLDITVWLAFDDLPHVAQRYITLKAARTLQDRVVGSDSLHGFNERDVMAAYFELKEFEGDVQDYTIFDDYSVARVIDRKVYTGIL